MKLSVRCPKPRKVEIPPSARCFLGIRHAHNDSRQRISDFWIPTVNVQKQDVAADATQLLIRAGYLRQAYAGIFQMLPLGLRVQEKLERLIDKHMRSVKASKVSLSSISSQALWEKSGRFKAGGEMFTFKDRKQTGWLLAPTHEEEITNLLAELIQNRQQLPVRLYQIGRKYRDEKRPRGGLLRGREFLMKDLYTFDPSPEQAHITYDEIRQAYRNFLDELKIRYIEARATSGDMGGNLSHEYHFPNHAGEDTVITCSNCDYAHNEEFVQHYAYESHRLESLDALLDLRESQEEFPRWIHQDFLSTDRRSLVRVVTPTLSEQSSVNPYAIKAALNSIVEIDTGVENPLQHFTSRLEEREGEKSEERRSIYYLLGSGLPTDWSPSKLSGQVVFDNFDHYLLRAAPSQEEGRINLLRQEAGDPCPDCGTGTLSVDKAIEIGHTFHLGTRYSSKLGLATKEEGGKDLVPVEMGCHGIGVSRLIAASASCLSDDVGLNWPRVIAPFEAVIIVQPSQGQRLRAAEELYDKLMACSSEPAVDIILDDRKQGMGWKLKDADMIGYPVIVIVGKGFDQGNVEVQCRRLRVKQEVGINDVPGFVQSLLKKV